VLAVLEMREQSLFELQIKSARHFLEKKLHHVLLETSFISNRNQYKNNKRCTRYL
jgi:hypothetical protein